jgi:elongation factor P--(R)-beta-lysine ligase
VTQHNNSNVTRAPSLVMLQQRAELLRRLREFFWQRGFIEVETPLLSNEIIPELHIEPMHVEGEGFLQASPEMHMKRLLAAGMGNIFQVTRSFRSDERGPLHHPEFTIVEWYREGDDMAAGMDLLDELMQELLGTSPALRTTYAEAFERHVGICPRTVTWHELNSVAATLGWLGSRVNEPPAHEPDGTDRDELLNFLLATRIEPHLGDQRPELLYHYPSSQASLARTTVLSNGHEVAERFELYYRGIELANGFHELADAEELRRRLEEVNALRTTNNHPALPLPTLLLAAMGDPGLPPCTGCALGFDRLAMLANSLQSISDVQIW